VNFERVQEIAEAVLYEGYMLYPYRPSSVKNRQRFNFGVLGPPSYCALQMGSEASFLKTECLLRANQSTRVTVKVRFLHIVQRMVRKLDAAGSAEYVDRLEVSGRAHEPWQEAEEQSFICESVDPASLKTERNMKFSFPAGDSVEQLRDAEGLLTGEIVRQWQSLTGSLILRAEHCRGDVMKLTLRVENQSDFDCNALPDQTSRDTSLLHSLVSAHAILGVENGEFLSLLEPPEGFEELARSCENKGAWPVLAGDDATTVLASPIILYDYPKIAPESVGNLFDGTEIDEILSLRILTLTDAEKNEIRQSDNRARELLDRTESIPDEQFMKLHGVLRGLTLEIRNE
jgi:hypothetical protein